ncbi:MAG: hypothetical protein JXA07_14610 [Spirochaetes bacterium]|nr:hypothetical protein [Spirochaetota bacterium]
MDTCLKPLEDNNNLQPGTIIRRTSPTKDQQGSFLKFDKEYNIILVNIIDMLTGYLLASEGVLKKQPDDRLYYYPTSFKDSPDYSRAMKIITAWPLYANNPVLQDKIVLFISGSYAPEQIVEMERTDSLNLLFVPVQQKFRLGRFPERRSRDRVCNDVFMLWLESLADDTHITYLSCIREQKDHIPLFYSAGDRPHEATAAQLRQEIYAFDPTHGGHIRSSGLKGDKKHFVVDAGSTYMGLGARTPKSHSEFVAKGLKKVFPDFEFTPEEGRGALGEKKVVATAGKKTAVKTAKKTGAKSSKKSR